MSQVKPVHSQGRKSLSRPTTTSSTMTSRKSLMNGKASVSNTLFSPTNRKSFGLNNSNAKEETPSPAFSTMASSKALNRTQRQDSFSTAVDSFKNARRDSIMSMKWGDASTKASSLASLNATLTSIPKLKSRTGITAQSLSVLPSEALGTSHTNRFFNNHQSMNDVETKKSELPSRNELLSDREFELGGGTLNNLEEKFADMEQQERGSCSSLQEILEARKPATARPPSSSKRGKINTNNVFTPRMERQPSIAEKLNKKPSNETPPKLKKRKSVVILKKSPSQSQSRTKLKKENNKSDIPLIPLVPLVKKQDQEKSPVKIIVEPRSAGKLDLSKVIKVQAREMEQQSQEEAASPKFDSTRVETVTMDEVQESSFRSSVQPKFIVRRDFLGSSRSVGSQSLRKQSQEKLEVSVGKDVLMNKPLETILSNFHENTEKSGVEFETKTVETLPIETIASMDENYQNVSVEQKPSKKVQMMNWFKEKLPEGGEKKVNVKVLELISRRNMWRKVEEEAAENKRSEASPERERYNSVLKQSGNSNWLELNMDNKKIQDYRSAGHKNFAGLVQKKDVRSSSSTMMVRHFDELDPVVIQPKFMEETGSMCFTELWGKKAKNEFYRTMRKAFQSDTFVNLESHCGLYRTQKGLTSEELMCRRIANGGINMAERRLSVRIPEEMPLSRKDHFSPRGIGKHTRAFVLQGAGRVKK